MNKMSRAHYFQHDGDSKGQVSAQSNPTLALLLGGTRPHADADSHEADIAG